MDSLLRYIPSETSFFLLKGWGARWGSNPRSQKFRVSGSAAELRAHRYFLPQNLERESRIFTYYIVERLAHWWAGKDFHPCIVKLPAQTWHAQKGSNPRPPGKPYGCPGALPLSYARVY
jgi:hypothetical protein